MLKSELLEVIANGENSGVEFKRDDCRPEQLAKEIVAMANLRGGMILLGVDDAGTIFGIQRENLEEWVMDTVVAKKIHPLLLPFYEEIMLEEGKRVAVVSFPQGVAKPYVVRDKGREEIFIRVGSTTRKATREQQARLFDSGGFWHMELLPVSGANLNALDIARLEDYLNNIIEDPEVPVRPGDSESSKKWEDDWIQRLCGLGLMTKVEGIGPVCTIAGLVLFGYQPRRFLRQAGLRVLAFDVESKEYQARMDEVLDKPMVGRWKKTDAGTRDLVENGIVEEWVQLMKPFLTQETDVQETGLRRDRVWLYPTEAIREVLVNALAHRDWTRSVDIETAVYGNRIEVISPGALQNTMTVDKMIAGQRSPRNPLIVEVLRDYGYVDARGMGIRTKVIPLMRKQNRTEPLFEATDDYLKTSLFRP